MFIFLLFWGKNTIKGGLKKWHNHIKTAISFGLVYVPITLHACVKSDDVSFNTLYKKTGERIRYKKTCEHCPEFINPDDIVKGYQYEKR